MFSNRLVSLFRHVSTPFAVCSRIMIHRADGACLFNRRFHRLFSVPRPSHYSRYSLAFIFRFNKVAIYTGTFINNPFLHSSDYRRVLWAALLFWGDHCVFRQEGVDLLKDPEIFSGAYYRRLASQSRYIVEPFAVGGLVLSLVCSVIAYPLTLRALRLIPPARQG